MPMDRPCCMEGVGGGKAPRPKGKKVSANPQPHPSALHIPFPRWGDVDGIAPMASLRRRDGVVDAVWEVWYGAEAQGKKFFPNPRPHSPPLHTGPGGGGMVSRRRKIFVGAEVSAPAYGRGGIRHRGTWKKKFFPT